MNLHDHDIRYEALQEGAQQKAVEDAVMLINEYKETPEVAAKKVNVPLELVLKALELQKNIPVEA